MRFRIVDDFLRIGSVPGRCAAKVGHLLSADCAALMTGELIVFQIAGHADANIVGIIQQAVSRIIHPAF
jgi:hypothetical protein